LFFLGGNARFVVPRESGAPVFLCGDSAPEQPYGEIRQNLRRDLRSPKREALWSSWDLLSSLS
jgi:hypothetical protein